MGTDREADRLKIKQILTATIVSLCNNGLSFESELCVEGLLGITLDRKDVLLVSIKETISSALKKKPKPAESQSQGGRQPQTTPNKQQKQLHLQQQQQQMQQQQFQQQQTPRKQQQQPQQTPHKQKQQAQEQPRTPGKPSSSAAAQDSFGHVKSEPSSTQKVVSESQTQCMAVQPYGGGYAQVQKSVKMVQNAQGVVEQKQMEWKTYTADGRVVEHKKVQEVQTVAPSGAPAQSAYAGQPMQSNISAAMPGYQASNIKLEPACEEDLYGQQDPDMYYEGEEPGYDDYNCMQDAYNAGQEAYMTGGYPVPGQQYDPSMDSMGELYQLTGASRGRGGGTKRPPAKRPKKEKLTTGKVPAIKKTAKPPPMAAAGDNPVCRSTPGKGASKEVNSSLVQRALDMVHEGKLSASTAINLFGIPKSTFYKKLATSNAEKGQQFMDEVDFEGMEEAWDDGMQGVYDPMDPAFANYSA